MMPGLGSKYDIKIDVTSKPKSDYLTDDYFELDLPVAPAVMVGDEIVIEGADVGQYEIEAEICRQLKLSPPDREEKGFLKKIFKG